jgi:hypothetical protein
MSSNIEYSWKILGLGRSQQIAEKAEKQLHELGFKHVKVVGLSNDQASDDRLIQLLGEEQWDGVSIGVCYLYSNFVLSHTYSRFVVVYEQEKI